MNTLPSEIQNIIFNDYWHFQFQYVLKELLFCMNLEIKIKKFLFRYCFRENLFSEDYLYYLKKFNNDIQKITKNKMLKVICDVNNLYLFYCFDINYNNNILTKVDKKLKYIAFYSITCSGQMRYFILSRFQELSKSTKLIY
jgi:hypothetical protein